MKIMFIYSIDDVESTLTPLQSWSTIQFGISYISSVLIAHGYQTRLLVLGNNNWKSSTQLLRTFMEEFEPNLVCFTAVFSQYPFIERTARFMRSQWPDKFLVIGGVHATLNPNEVIDAPFDGLCIGEGEYPTLELCNQLAEGKSAPHGIANLWLKSHNGIIERNESRDFLQNLDMLPFPDRDMWKPWMKEQVDDELTVLLGRGCAYNCTYCSNHVLRKTARGTYVRMRTPENILKELAFIHKNYQHRKIVFEVESIALNKPWTLELCRQLETFNSTIDTPNSYGCAFRISPQSMDEKLFIAFKKANFYRISIGLESGSERIRREVLKRNYSNDEFLNVVSMAREKGLKIYVFNMIGIPGESLSEHMETVQLNRQCQPDGHYTSIFYPYPGTELYNTCVKQGLIKGPVDTQRERKHANIELPNFTKSQIQSAYTWFNYRVYKGHKPHWMILIQVIAVKVKSYPITNLLYRKIVQWPIIRHVRAWWMCEKLKRE